MASTYILLFLIVVGVPSFLVLRQYRRLRKEQALRLAPLPPKKVIEVKLPRDVTDANSRMRRFYGRVATITSSDPQAREEGLGQLDLIYLVDRPPNFLTPTLRFYIVADERAMPTVKRALKVAFESQAEVFPVEIDPLGDVFEQLRQRALAEAQGEDQGEDHLPGSDEGQETLSTPGPKLAQAAKPPAQAAPTVAASGRPQR